MAVAANANALITAAELATILQTTFSDSDYAQTLINMSSDVIEKYCDRKLIKDAYTQEIYNGNNQNIMYLKNYPIDSGETFTLESWNTYDNVNDYTFTINDDYLVYYTEGYVFKRAKFISGYQNYRITYTAGYLIADVPYDLKVACAQVCSFIDKTKSNYGISSERIGDYSISYGAADVSLVLVGIPQSVVPILRRYKRYEVI